MNRFITGFKPGGMSRCIALATLLATSLASATEIQPREEIDRFVPEASLVGSARMRVLLWDVYDASLFAPEGEWQAAGPYALSLAYLRELQGEAIAARAIEEIRNQGRTDEATLTRWFELMREIIPDVDRETELLGIADANQHAIFLRDGELLGRVEDPEFTRAFFGIWLSEATSEPGLRKQLLGDK